MKYYTTFPQFFVDWSLRNTFEFHSDSAAGIALCRYFDVMIIDHTPPFEGRNMLFAYLLFFPNPDKVDTMRLPLARRALRGWNVMMPGGSKYPAPLWLLFLLAAEMLADGKLLAAFADILQCDTYARPSEILGLQWESLAKPLELLPSAQWYKCIRGFRGDGNRRLAKFNKFKWALVLEDSSFVDQRCCHRLRRFVRVDWPHLSQPRPIAVRTPFSHLCKTARALNIWSVAARVSPLRSIS